MDPKAQIVGEVIKQLRPPDTLPMPEEARGQFRRMVELLDEPPPASVQVSDLTCPGPAGPIPLRLYAPHGTAARSLLLYFHGGGWMQGGLETHHGACGKLAAWSGCQVLAVDYRLAPEHKFPAGLEDCLAAWRWLVANTATLGADPGRLAIGGNSAGGNLAAAVCQALVADGEPAPAAQLLVYPSLDLGWGLPSHRDLADAYVLPRIRVQWYTDLYLSSPEQAADVRASPLRADDLQRPAPRDDRHRRFRSAARRRTSLCRAPRGGGDAGDLPRVSGPDPRLHFPHARHPAGQRVSAGGGELAEVKARLTVCRRATVLKPSNPGDHAGRFAWPPSIIECIADIPANSAARGAHPREASR